MRAPISIIIPNYNHGRFIGEALKSIFTQLENDDEIIIVDDKSTDGSVTIIKASIGDDPKVQLIINDRNKGALYTINRGLSLARHPYVCFPGADDIIADGTFAAAVSLLMEHPTAGFCSGFSHQIDAAGRDLGRLPTRLVLKEAGYLSPSRVSAELLRDDTWILGLAVFRTEILRSVGGFPEELGSFADGFIERLIALRFGCCFVPKTFQFWRRLDTGLSSIETIDAAYVEKIGEKAFLLMKNDYAGDFPSDYPGIWRARWRFGAKRRVLKMQQQQRWLRIMRHTAPGGGAARLVSSIMGIFRLPAEMFLFMRYRPTDTVAVLNRYLRPWS